VTFSRVFTQCYREYWAYILICSRDWILPLVDRKRLEAFENVNLEKNGQC